MKKKMFYLHPTFHTDWLDHYFYLVLLCCLMIEFYTVIFDISIETLLLKSYKLKPSYEHNSAQTFPHNIFLT